MEKTASRMANAMTKEQKKKIDSFVNKTRDDILKFNLSLTNDPQEFLNSLMGLLGGIQFVVLGTAVSQMVKEEFQSETFNELLDLLCERTKKIYKENNQ